MTRSKNVAGRAIEWSSLLVLLIASGCREKVSPGKEHQGPKGFISSADILVERETVRPGTTVYLGVQIRLAPGWHTYSDPPGDSGMAPVLTLDVPDGVKAGPLQYPPHNEFPDAAGTTYGYEGSVLLKVPLRIPESAEEQAPVRIRGTLDYLVCKEMCVPQSAELHGTFTIGSTLSAPTPEWEKACGEGGWEHKAKNE